LGERLNGIQEVKGSTPFISITEQKSNKRLAILMASLLFSLTAAGFANVPKSDATKTSTLRSGVVVGSGVGFLLTVFFLVDTLPTRWPGCHLIVGTVGQSMGVRNSCRGGPALT
jgi:hypothetical protein